MIYKRRCGPVKSFFVNINFLSLNNSFVCRLLPLIATFNLPKRTSMSPIDLPLPEFCGSNNNCNTLQLS